MPKPSYSGPGGRLHFIDLIIAWLCLIFIRLLKSTWRIKVIGLHQREIAENNSKTKAFAMAIWHENLLATIAVHAGQRFAPLASLSRDGDIVSWVMNHLGFITLRGSSSRGGREAIQEIIRALGLGYFTALTVDGPRGPRREAKFGIVDIARRTGVMILPVCARADRQFILSRSWDRFRIPMPFSRVYLLYGQPFAIPTDVDRRGMAEWRGKIDQELNALESSWPNLPMASIEKVTKP